MNWSIDLSRDADKFLRKNQNIEDVLIIEIKKLINKLEGETVNINFKKLSGIWDGYYRIRKGKIRIIVFPDYLNKVIYVETIDFRGDVYK